MHPWKCGRVGGNSKLKSKNSKLLRDSHPGTFVPLRENNRYTVVVNAESQSGIDLAYSNAGAAAHPGTGGSQDRVSEQIQPTPGIGNGGSIVAGTGGTSVSKDPSGSE